MNITDFHTHPFLTDSQNMCYYKSGLRLSPEDQRALLSDAGITKICGSVIEGRAEVSGFDYLRRLNRDALRLRDRLGGFYVPGFHIHPKFVSESLEEIEFMRCNGVGLIGELVHYMHCWDGFDPAGLSEILDAAGEYRMIFSYHTPFSFDMTELIESHPNVSFVAAHPGDRDRLPEHISLLKKFDNYFLDLSGTGLFRFGMLRRLVDEAGAEKILFGTDFPICNPRMYVQAVYGERLTERERGMILSENAERLLSLF